MKNRQKSPCWILAYLTRALNTIRPKIGNTVVVVNYKLAYFRSPVKVSILDTNQDSQKNDVVDICENRKLIGGLLWALVVNP